MPYQAPFAVTVKLDTLMVSPAVKSTDGKLRSAPEVPTVPWATTVVPAELVQMRQYPAVPVAAAASEVMALMVSTPEDTVPMVADIGSEASRGGGPTMKPNVAAAVDAACVTLLETAGGLVAHPSPLAADH